MTAVRSSGVQAPPVSGKPAPTLQAEQPGRLTMLGDLGWFLGSMARTASRPFLLWITVALLQGLLVPVQLWLTKSLVDALAGQLRSGAARGVLVWLGLLVVSPLVERALGGVQPLLADRVIVLRDGEIVEEGRHDDLVARGGLYARIFAAQAQWYR